MAMNKLESSPLVHFESRDRRLPEWFRLGFSFGTDGPDPLPPQIILAVEKSALVHFMEDIERNTLVKYAGEHLTHRNASAEFLTDIREPWGFGGILKPYAPAEPNDFLHFAINIPRVEKEAGFCRDCEGTGKDQITGQGTCHRCNGSKKETKQDQSELNMISATLCAIHPLLERPYEVWLRDVKDVGRPQLLSLITSFGPQCPFIAVVFSPEVVGFLARNAGRTLPQIESAMWKTYIQMVPGYERYGPYGFEASVDREGCPSFSVSRDALMSVSGFRQPSSRDRMKFDSTEVMSYHQQVSLLAGIAMLCDMVKTTR
ncbi:MAG: hypothetical protein JWN37_567 [Candidatus Nomurabacteria bacterium]|nr:hypothetical protein [Candidatus Nomurabacteria bacterium]